MSLLITGGNGHVGSTIVKMAAATGRDVVALVRDPSRVPANLIAESGSSVKWVACDLTDPFQIAAIAAEHDIDRCIHSGAVPNQKLAVAAPWQTVQTNIGATAALLEVARRQGWKRFVNVSTGSVFQTETDFAKPLLEDADVSPLSVYSATKHSGELMTRMYRHDYGLSAASIRISFIYGPPLVPLSRDLPRGPIVSLLREAILGLPINEPSGGDFEASFTYVDDVVSGLLAAVDAASLNHHVYHLGNGQNWNTFAVVDAIRDAVPGAQITVGPGTEPWTTYNPMRGPLSGTRLAEDTGFVSQYPLEKGVRAFAEWMRANPEKIGRKR